MEAQSSEQDTQSASEVSEAKNPPNWDNDFELLEYTLEFLNTNNELNLVLAGYFSKLITSLFNTKKKDLCMYLFSDENNHILNFARHSYSKSIADILSNILRCDNMNSGLNRFNAEKVWAKKKQVL